VSIEQSDRHAGETGRKTGAEGAITPENSQAKGPRGDFAIWKAAQPRQRSKHLAEYGVVRNL